MHRDLTQAALALAIGLAAALLPAAASAKDDGGWQPCANEGQTCNVQGRAVVRYGEAGRWLTRSVIGSVVCGNDAFGDPAPDVAKRCEVRAGGGRSRRGGERSRDREPQTGTGSIGWTFCAAEGEICRFRGQTQVRFGEGNRFTTRTAQDSVRCDIADFGDPVPNVTKTCEVRSTHAVAGGSNRPNAWSGWGDSSATNGWRYCAAEDERCDVQGTAKVRFGEGRKFKTRTVTDGVDCSKRVFGDPAYGVVKHCEVEAVARSDSSTSNDGWTACADEGGRCDFTGRSQVRYGTSGRYVYRDATNGVRCDSANFGSDPYENRVKRCEIRR
ncbi:MAG: hypothetical protein ABIN96_10730 [Rubrivivax sp.]